jgi:hypothetical protein
MVGCQLHTPTILPSGKGPHYLLDRRLVGCQNQSGHGGEEKILLPCWESNPDHPAHCY